MHSYPQPALALVAEMETAAAAEPARAMALQGAPGCNGHRAALEYDPDCLPLPCFAFEDALDAVSSGGVAHWDGSGASWGAVAQALRTESAHSS